MKRTFLLAGLLYAASLGAATNLTIVSKNGNSQQIGLKTLSNLTFQGDSLQLNYKNGQAEFVTFNTIQKLFFITTPDGVNTPKNEKITLSQNPVRNSFILNGLLTENTRISIWNISGQKVLETVVSPNETVSVNQIPAGMYFVRINNITLKMLKQ